MAKMFFLSMASLALMTSTAVAEPSPRPQSELRQITASCADLRAEVRANRAECNSFAQPSTFLRPTLIAETQEGGTRKRMIRMPWMIGVFQ